MKTLKIVVDSGFPPLTKTNCEAYLYLIIPLLPSSPDTQLLHCSDYAILLKCPRLPIPHCSYREGVSSFTSICCLLHPQCFITFDIFRPCFYHPPTRINFIWNRWALGLLSRLRKRTLKMHILIIRYRCLRLWSSSVTHRMIDLMLLFYPFRIVFTSASKFISFTAIKFQDSSYFLIFLRLRLMRLRLILFSCCLSF